MAKNEFRSVWLPVLHSFFPHDKQHAICHHDLKSEMIRMREIPGTSPRAGKHTRVRPRKIARRQSGAKSANSNGLSRFCARPFGRHFRFVSLAFLPGNSFGYSPRAKSQRYFAKKCRWHRRPLLVLSLHDTVGKFLRHAGESRHLSS